MIVMHTMIDLMLKPGRQMSDAVKKKDYTW